MWGIVFPARNAGWLRYLCMVDTVLGEPDRGYPTIPQRANKYTRICLMPHWITIWSSVHLVSLFHFVGLTTNGGSQLRTISGFDVEHVRLMDGKATQCDTPNFQAVSTQSKLIDLKPTRTILRYILRKRYRPYIAMQALGNGLSLKARRCYART